MLPFTAVHHVAIICTDLEAAKQFYVDKLGFTVLRETHRADRNDCKLDLKLGDMELELFVKPDAPTRPSYPEACGLRHLAFRVTDVPAAVEALKARGIPCEAIREDDVTGGKMTFFQDPNGLPLEIHEG